MQTTDHDLELLETYLDGQLPPAQTATLRRRLSSEPTLALTMDRLRQQRQLRQQAWQQMQPTPASVDQLICRVQSSIHRRRQFSRLLHAARPFAAAAACLAMFTIGWFGHNWANSPSSQTIQSPVYTSDTPASFEVPLFDDAGNVVAVQKFHSPDQAREFANDLTTWQAQQKLHQPHTTPVSIEKF